MHLRRGEFERIRSVLLEVEPDEPLTAREILDLLDEHGEAFDSAHKVATILGRYAGTEVEVIPDRPYRYRIRHN
ncbi:hypothetical protein [Halocatena marina]|uniref:Uncharacterized protein n=1 Tax=Halocatena marina TaxID=2934937 RepID=A0ABD5YLN7_9EURY|nr:hypothetical protein [Halocatena marina]